MERGIRECHAKRILARNLPLYGCKCLHTLNKLLLVDETADLDSLEKAHSWLAEELLAVKADQLIGRREKQGLLVLGVDFKNAKVFLKEGIGKEVTIDGTSGVLTHFLVEPFVEHTKEYYLAITTERDSDIMYFSTQGGVDIEDHWKSVKTVRLPVLASVEDSDLETLFADLPADEKGLISMFAKALHTMFRDLEFTFLELNPFTLHKESIIPLDCRAKLDDASAFENASKWGQIEFPPPFGSGAKEEEKFIEALDEKTGASLKLKVLNPNGRIWTMVAGGGASVIYADTICDLGYQGELADYGEYSGNPNEEETYQYARTILELMTKEKSHRQNGKILLIGGGIANFTDVAETFKGIVRALKEYARKLKESKVRIYVRRGGPNYEKGLEMMKELGKTLGVPVSVYGPETHMTRIIPIALSNR